MLIVDTGPLVAAADRADRHHAQYRDMLETDPGPFVTTAMVVAETAYLLERQLGAEAEVALYDLILDGTLRVESLTKVDWVRVRVLVDRYRDLRSAEPTPVSLRSPNAYGCRVSPRLTERTSPWFAPTTSKPSNSSHCRPDRLGVEEPGPCEIAHDVRDGAEYRRAP